MSTAGTNYVVRVHHYSWKKGNDKTVTDATKENEYIRR